MAVCGLQATHRPTVTDLLLQNCVIQVSLLRGVWNSGAAPAGVHRGAAAIDWFFKTVFKMTYISESVVVVVVVVIPYAVCVGTYLSIHR